MTTTPIFKTAQGREAILSVYDRILQRWPVPYQTRMIPSEYGETFVLACGDEGAPPLVLLHGSASNSAMWIGDASTYSKSYRVYAIDLPGEPGKSEAVRFDLDGPAGAEWMRAVFAGLGLGRVTLLGISLGGWMALKFATTYPERVEKLALLCPGGVSPEKGDFFLKALPFLFLGKWGSSRIMAFLNAGIPLDPETIRFSHLINTNFNPRRHGGPLFADEELQRLHMPVLLIAGAKDPLLDMQSTAARLQRLLPCFTADVLPDAGHILANMAGRVVPFLESGDQLASRLVA